MPITRSGRPVTAASDAIGIDDVFDARIASAGNTWSACRKISSFTPASSTTASIIRSAGTSSSTGETRPSTSSGVGAALLGELLEALPHRLEPALDRARRRVVQRHLPPRRRDDLRDPAAHLAGADDEDVLEAHAEA